MYILTCSEYSENRVKCNHMVYSCQIPAISLPTPQNASAHNLMIQMRVKGYIGNWKNQKEQVKRVICYTYLFTASTTKSSSGGQVSFQLDTAATKSTKRQNSGSSARRLPYQKRGSTFLTMESLSEGRRINIIEIYFVEIYCVELFYRFRNFFSKYATCSP